jgi:tripartite-type tricarboxylate transporter receptor subunit TctC
MRGLRLVTACILLSLAAFAAQADPVEEFYRGRQLSLYIGFDAGGGYDLTARALAQHMGRHLPGNPTIVPRNMPGAGSLKLANYLYGVAPRDGSEFGLFARTMPLEPLIGKDATFDARRFGWLGSPSNEVSTCVAWHTAPVQSAQDLLTTELITGGTGASSPSTVFPNILNAVLGTRIRVINGYGGSTDALLAMERGEVTGNCAWGWVPMKATKGDWLRDRKITVLLQLGMKKAPDHPEVPLALDLARTDKDRQLLELVFAPQIFARPFTAPPGLAPERLAALRRAFAATLTDPAFLRDADRQQLEIDFVSPQEIEALLARLYASPPDLIARAAAAMAGAP